MKPAGARKKGARYELQIASLYREYGIDPDASRMPLSGAHSELKGDIRKPADTEWVDECKNQEVVHFWKWWQQAVDQCILEQRPVLHITSNRKESLTVLRTEDYMSLRSHSLQGGSNDRKPNT